MIEQTRNVLMDKLKQDGIFQFNGYIQNESRLTPTVTFKLFAKYYGLVFSEANRMTGDEDIKELLSEKKYSGWLKDAVLRMDLEWDNKWDIMEPIMPLLYKWNKIPHSKSVAASGVIMTDYKPDLPVRDGVISYNSHDMEDNGFIKYDLLSIDTLNEIQPFYGLTIPWGENSDPKVWDVIKEGDTDFVFQFSSPGMKRLLKDNKTSNIQSLGEINALYRPGPIGLGLLETYTENTRGNIVFSPEDTVLYLLFKREFGEDHSGMMIFQEDIMKMSEVGAGFTLEEADGIRKATGKKILSLLESYKEKFEDRWKYSQYLDFGKFGKYLFDDIIELEDGSKHEAKEIWDRISAGEDLDLVEGLSYHQKV